MATLQQAASVAAFTLRNSPTVGRRKITEQMARDLAEPQAAAYVSEHLEEYEDVPAAIAEYVDAFVAAFGVEQGFLTAVQYEAHTQAWKDAQEERDRAKRWGLTISDDPLYVSVNAQMKSWSYITARFVPVGTTQAQMQELAGHLLGNPEVIRILNEYKDQYAVSYKECLAAPEEPAAQPKDAPSAGGQSEQKKRPWWKF